ncbi:D-alanine--(R)-lactate ligase [Kribbella sp. NPDC055071]
MKMKIGILFGGVTEEHPVSIKSAQEVARNLDLDKFEPYWVGISKTGAWKLCDGPSEDWEAGTTHPVVLSPDRDVHGLLVLEEGKYTTIRLDVVLPVLHGKLSEDGAIQGLLELAGIPYVGCDIPSSAMSMDKALTYTVVKAAGIPTPNFWIVPADEKVDPDQFTYPIFVKPARSGSSFGVNKVSNKEELAGAMEEAREFDSKVLIEEAIVGTEIGSAVMGNEELFVAELDQINLTSGFFRPHQEDNPEEGFVASTITVPADLDDATATKVKETAKAIYRALGCRGLARVDMFLLEDGTVMLNEVNTFPGLTSYSRYPRMMQAAGVTFTEMIDRWVSLAVTGKADGV